MPVSKGRGTLLLSRPRTCWSLLTGIATWAACSTVGNVWIDLGTFLLCLGVVLAESVLYPAWIRADARGVTVWHSFNRTVFPWREIRGFALGNPDRPRIAYLLRETGGRVTPVELPDLRDPVPADVVSLLSERQRSLASVGETSHEAG